MHHRLISGLGAAALAVGLTASAHAGGSILTNEGHQIIQTPVGQGAYHDGITPLYGPRQEYVGLGDRDDIVELHVNHTAVYIHPDTQYRQRRPGRIDENHSLLRAQRAYADRHTLPTRVIRRDHPAAHRPAEVIRPVLILLKPDYLERRQPQPPKATPAIPSVPRHEATPADDDRLMATAR